MALILDRTSAALSALNLNLSMKAWKQGLGFQHPFTFRA